MRLQSSESKKEKNKKKKKKKRNDYIGKSTIIEFVQPTHPLLRFNFSRGSRDISTVLILCSISRLSLLEDSLYPCN